MNPPMVYELTKPRTQRTTKTIAMVSAWYLSFCYKLAIRKSSGPLPPNYYICWGHPSSIARQPQ